MKHGFTLIKVLIVIAILAIIVALTVPGLVALEDKKIEGVMNWQKYAVADAVDGLAWHLVQDDGTMFVLDDPYSKLKGYLLSKKETYRAILRVRIIDENRSLRLYRAKITNVYNIRFLNDPEEDK